jgi:hypothetical protein
MGQINRFTEQVDTLVYPSRLLKVHPTTKLTPGTVVTDPLGTSYLLVQHLDSFNSGAIYRTFRMILMDQRLQWSRQTTIIDPVTKLEKGTGTENLGLIDLMVDPDGLVKGKVKIAESKVKIVCGADLKVGDRVGDYSVTFVDTVLGVTVAEAR